MRKLSFYPREFNHFLWKFLITRLARSHGFLDPVHLLAKLNRFAQPSEVLAPTELLRATAVLHARGLINSQAIQHNLDWVWPYWVVCQFDPRSTSFVPRAFSLTHINLTHRNWTAVGSPHYQDLPIIDPRGLLTPFWDSWSLDAWLITEQGTGIFPSRLERAEQKLCLDAKVAVRTTIESLGMQLVSTVKVREEKRNPICHMHLRAQSSIGGWIGLSLRPYNPEGVSFIHQIDQLDEALGWKVNRKSEVHFSSPADQSSLSNYSRGDVSRALLKNDMVKHISCDIGMASALALFKIPEAGFREVEITMPLRDQPEAVSANIPISIEPEWKEILDGGCQLHFPGQDHLQFLYDAALRTLILHTSEDVFAGPYTYKRFWFRDAAFILNALLLAGFPRRVETMLDKFPGRQKVTGYFESQEGEWDSNGEVLWILAKYTELTGQKKDPWQKMIHSAARWIQRKRLPPGKLPHAGLLPPGFSAEHLGPNDYYYWDNFWSIAGLKAAGYLSEIYGDNKSANSFYEEAESLSQSVDESLKKVAQQLGTRAMPASPYRRLDSASIGSLAAGYPLQLWGAEDPRLIETAHYLLSACIVEGAFFHDMSHSGINPYLTLHLAQVLLRAGDRRYFDLTEALAKLASPTGQWPEAIHPRTKGGCMGDGQHVWAAAEWILLIRNCFVREEKQRLILCQGLHSSWLGQSAEISFGPAPTSFGKISITVQLTPDELTVSWTAEWHKSPVPIEIRFPGQPVMIVPMGESRAVFQRGRIK